LLLLRTHGRRRRHGLQAVVGEAAAMGVEVVDALFERRQQIVEGVDGRAGRCRQPADVGKQGGGICCLQQAVGAEGG